MIAGHLIYKVENLDNGVKEWRHKGFAVEYGRAKNPYNAIIYFSEGPYIELLASTGMPRFFKVLLKTLGYKGVVKRFDSWDYSTNRWCGFCIEKDSGDLTEEINQLGKYKDRGFNMKSAKRTDTHGRKLKFKCFFPAELSLPFLMSYFNVDPKPRNFVHPNGYKRVSKITFATTTEASKIIQELLDDPIVEIVVTGDEGVVKEVQFA